MRQIVMEAEATLDYNAVYTKTRLAVLDKIETMTEAEAACSSVVKTAYDVRSPCIIVLSKSGAAAQTISKYRPAAPIFMVSTNDKAIRYCACMRGVVPVQAKTGLTTEERLKNAIEHAKALGLAKSGDVITAIHGKDGSTNLIKMVAVDGVDATLEERKNSKLLYKDPKNYCQASLFLPRSMGDFDMLEYTQDSYTRKCKILCTMGPSCWSVENLVKLIDSGMNVARLNFSHGDHEDHGACVQRIREADKLRPKKPIAILLDTKGPEIRTGFFASGGKVDLKAGQDLKLVVDYSFKGDNKCFAVTYAKLPTAVVPGNQILIADGSLVLKVKSCGSDHVMTEVMNDCSLGERKNCNLPGVKVDLPVLQDKDVNDLVNFGIPQGVHFVAASFVQSAADVKLIRQTLGEKGKQIKIISKIENQEGLQNFDEICMESDAIMIARGDLGMEVPPEKVFLAQKIMTAKCNAMGKPVITATQMLESMCKAPRPTRAEAGDVANAVLDGTDCVMLSGETAGGMFPVEAVTTMRRVVEEAEKNLDYLGTQLTLRANALSKSGRLSSLESFASTAVKTATDMGAPLILVFAGDGTTVRMVAKYRPQATILAITNSEAVQRQLLTSRGVISMLEPSYDGLLGVGTDVDALSKKAIGYAQELGMPGLTKGAPVVMVSEEKAVGGGMNSRITKIVPAP
jgi:pyruvate kinase